MKNIRAKNLDFIRWMNYGHKHTAVKLKNVISNDCLLSAMALGKTKISDFDARNIEKELSLPAGCEPPYRLKNNGCIFACTLIVS